MKSTKYPFEKLGNSDDIYLEGQKERSIAIRWLMVSGLLTVFLWQIPFGNYFLYPFTILATWFHEMGHGMTALLLGGHFHHLEIFSNGSGVAYHSGGVFFARPFVAAGGLLGPPIAGAFFILAGSRPQLSRWVLGGLSTALLLSTLIWVRSPFGWVILPLLGIGLWILSQKGSAGAQQMTVQFLGVQACLGTFRQLDYLFMNQINMGGKIMYSDTAQIAQSLLLPYWFWGSLIALFSFVLLIGSVRMAYGKKH
jgi:hypothetical protein